MTTLFSEAGDILYHHSHYNTDNDFGIKIEHFLKSQLVKYFGIKKPLEESAPETEGAFRDEYQSASDQVLLAEGLTVEYVTRNAGNNKVSHHT